MKIDDLEKVQHVVGSDPHAGGSDWTSDDLERFLVTPCPAPPPARKPPERPGAGRGSTTPDGVSAPDRPPMMPIMPTANTSDEGSFFFSYFSLIIFCV